PLNRIRPVLGVPSRKMARANVDLPHPDSPTRLSVSPGARVSETPATAPMLPTLRWKMRPRVIGNSTPTSSTLRSAASAATELIDIGQNLGGAVAGGHRSAEP